MSSDEAPISRPLTTPVTSLGAGPIYPSPLFTQPTVFRYPTCAVQGTPLMYSAVMAAGQPLFPWRPFSALGDQTSVTVSPNVNVLQPAGTPTMSSFMQIPSYPYLTLTSLFNQHQAQQQQVRDDDIKPLQPSTPRYKTLPPSSPTHLSKRPRLSVGGSCSNSSKSSPIVKLVDYTLSGLSNTNNTSVDGTSFQVSRPSPVDSQHPTSSLVMSPSSSWSLDDVLLLKCFGMFSESSVVEQYKLKVSTILEDLYSSFFMSLTNLPLPYETCVICTINYLNSLSNGDTICVHTLHHLLQQTELSEATWLHYHKKHNKMSESTFVQYQFIHFVKQLVQFNTGNVCVIVTQNDLIDGVNIAMNSLKKRGNGQIPKVIAILAVHQSNPIDFCLLVIDRLMSKSLTVADDDDDNTVQLEINQCLLLQIQLVQAMLNGQVYHPFSHHIIPNDEANSSIPNHFSVIDYKLCTPSIEELNIAHYLFQKVVSLDQMELYERIDFFVICPCYPLLASQLVKDVCQSGLIPLSDDLVKDCSCRVVCNEASDIRSMIGAINSHPSTLYVVIIKCAHLTCSVVTNDRNSQYLSTDCKELLDCDNCIILSLSAHPYSLQTNCSLFLPSNEVYWPLGSRRQDDSGSVFHSAIDYIPGHATESNHVVNVQGDPQFEKDVSHFCNNNRSKSSIMSIRAQVLLSDYVKALVNSVSSLRHSQSSLKTQSIVDKLVKMPLTNRNGYGIMVTIRCHDDDLAKDFYCKLKSVRNILGLKFRFEVCLDNRESHLTLSDHFVKRARVYNNIPDNVKNDMFTYEHLLNVPCVIVMSGTNLPSVKMPSSLVYVDLRLLHSTHLTRTQYESDISISNRYSAPLKSYECSCLASCCSANSIKPSASNIIEWKPTPEDNSNHLNNSEVFNYNGTDIQCSTNNINHHGRSIAIVEIPQPDDELADSLTTTTHDLNIDKVEQTLLNSLDEISSSNEMEIEDMNHDESVIVLMSQQYYSIWESSLRNCVLPPADGVGWKSTHKRPPLLDHSLYGQSVYYRNWSRPKRKIYQQVDVKGYEKRFLLCGPSGVGKFKASLLLVHLLKDYMRSNQGISAINQSPLLLPLGYQSTTHSQVLLMEQLGDTCDVTCKTEQPSLSSLESVNNSGIVMAVPSTMIHNAAHSCPKCTKNTSVITHTLSSQIPFIDTTPITIKWNIPSHRLNYITTLHDSTLDFIHMSSLTLICSLSMDYTDNSLLNFTHTASDNLHIIITKHSLMESCRNNWPKSIIGSVPDLALSGMGSSLEIVKSLGKHFYQRNVEEKGEADVSPWLLICNDRVCMVQERRNDKEVSISLSNLLKQLCDHYSDYSCISLPHWSDSAPPADSIYSLDSNFLLINLKQATDINFNPFNHKSAIVDYHLKLLTNEHRVVIPDQYCYIRKQCDDDEGDTSSFELPSTLLAQPDKLVISLHHDSSALFNIPGPLLLETFLYHKSTCLFPSLNRPLLMVDNYINLGPHIKVVLTSVDKLMEFTSIMFGGLVLYLCEGKVSAEMLQQLQFVPGACLLLITRGCKGLVKEVSRLDLEENWEFKLRDEFQTACHDKFHPLFFLTGKFSPVKSM